MFCQECPIRNHCERACEALEAHLKSLEGYQREVPVSPDLIGVIGERAISMAELQPERPYIWDQVAIGVSALPPELFMPFILHYHDHLSEIEAARALGLHRSTVHRRLKRAVKIIRQELADRGELSIPGEAPACFELEAPKTEPELASAGPSESARAEWEPE